MNRERLRALLMGPDCPAGLVDRVSDVCEAAWAYFGESPEHFEGLNPKWFKQQAIARDALAALDEALRQNQEGK